MSARPSAKLGLDAIRAVPRAVWAVTLIFVAALFLYSVMVPLFYSQDEYEHAELAWDVRDQTGWPSRQESIFDERWVVARDLYRTKRTVETAVPRGQRPSLDELARPGDAPRGEINNAWQHPPLYYTTVALVVTAIAPFAVEWSWDLSMSVMRLASVLMLLPVPVLTAATVIRLRGSRAVAVTAAAVPLAVPGLLHVGAAVNNDNLLILLSSILTLVLASVIMGDLSTRTAVVAGVLGAAAALTKGTGLFIVGWIPIAYGYVGLRERSRLGSTIRTGSIAVGLTAVLGVWWYVRNLLRYGRLQPTRIWPDPSDDFVPDVGSWIGRALQGYTLTFWEHFVGASLPRIAAATFVIIVVVGVAIALFRSPGDQRQRMIVLLLPVAGLAAILLLGAWSVYTATGRFQGMQGRYFYPALTGVAVAAAVGFHSLPIRARSVSRVVVLAAVAVQIFVLGFLLVSFWGDETATIIERLSALLAWSPWPAGALPIASLALVIGTLWAMGTIGSLPVRSSGDGWVGQAWLGPETSSGKYSGGNRQIS